MNQKASPKQPKIPVTPKTSAFNKANGGKPQQHQQQVKQVGQNTQLLASVSRRPLAATNPKPSANLKTVQQRNVSQKNITISRVLSAIKPPNKDTKSKLTPSQQFTPTKLKEAAATFQLSDLNRRKLPGHVPFGAVESKAFHESEFKNSIQTVSTSTLADLQRTDDEFIEYQPDTRAAFTLQSLQDFRRDDEKEKKETVEPYLWSVDDEPSSVKSSKSNSGSIINESEPAPSEPQDDAISIRTSRSDDDTISVRTEDFITSDGELKENSILYTDDDQSTILGAQSTTALTDAGDDDITSDLTDNATTEAPESKSCKTNTTIESQVITSKNVKKIDWTNDYVALTIKKCLHPIREIKLDTIKHSLKTLKFSSLTSFKVVLHFLQHCKKLEKLSFTNVQLVQKHDAIVLTNSESTIRVEKLKELELTEWVFSLTKNEYWLLDFFYKCISFPKLESFTLRGSDSFQWERSVRKAENRLREIEDPSIVLKFLIKNHQNLRKLSLGGLGFQILNSTHPDAPKLGSEIALLTDGFHDLRIPMNATGINLILEQQSKLHRLAFCGFLLSNFNEAQKDMLYASIERNKETLECIGIFPCILQDGSFKGTGIGLYELTCTYFQFCKNLKHLFINITTAHKAFTKRFSCGKVSHIHELPSSLITLEIYTHKLDLHELQKLADRFSEFAHLQRLVLSTNIKKCYIVPVDWVKTLFSLPAFLLVDFFGGCIGNRIDFENYLNSDQGNGILMTEIMDCVSFERKILIAAAVALEREEKMSNVYYNSNDDSNETQTG